jgi:hypothetical protein
MAAKKFGMGSKSGGPAERPAGRYAGLGDSPA